MGFKDLGRFNDAMLEKEVWRLLKDQSSLFYRVFKAKYFPRGSIFEASVATGSYAWQSILKLRKVISLGMRWKIDNGRSIDIYKDNWLPRKGSAKIVSPHRPELDGAQVTALINPSTHSWDQNMVDQNFLLFEANRIKAIPLCWMDRCDRIIWPDSPDGNYLVKVGYQKLCEEVDANNASTSNPTQQKSFWKKVWKLQVPNKIKNFLRRVCSNALPTKENLKKRKIIDNASCNACLTEQESIFHTLWEREAQSRVGALFQLGPNRAS